MHKQYVILADDRLWLEKRIAELDKEISDLGPEFYDVFNQTSETWHDNAPFEALRDRQTVMAAERADLKNVLLHNTLPVPKLRKGSVGIGSVVELNDGRRVLIAGHWTHRAGKKLSGVLVVSCETPLAEAVLGKKIGTKTQFGTITAIE